MVDLATLGFAIDSGPVVSADKALMNFAQSGKAAQASTDALVDSTDELGSSTDKARQQLASANDNMSRAANQAMKLSDATKQASAANDNLSDGFKSTIDGAQKTAEAFIKSAAHIIKWGGYISLVSKFALASSPALQGFADKLGKGVGSASAVASKATDATVASLEKLGPVGVKAGSAIVGVGAAVKVAHGALVPFLKIADGLEVITLAKHFGMAGAAAYALSPALRSVANKEVTHGLAAIPSALGATTPILSSMLPLLSSALSFLSRFAVPIAAALVLWKLLTSAIGQGAALLEKYGNEQRNLVEGVDENLAKLTKFQEANLSAAQVEQAAKLGARLNEAKKIIGDFITKQLDLNDAGLKLQSVWVRIVELIAEAVKKLNEMPPWAVKAMIGAAVGGTIGSVIPGVGTVVGAVAGGVAGAATDLFSGDKAPSSSGVASLSEKEAAKNRLADQLRIQTLERLNNVEMTKNDKALKERIEASAGFSTKFGLGVNDLAEKKEKEKKDIKEAASMFDKLVESTNRSTAAEESRIQTVGKTIGEQKKLEVQFKLTEAANQEIAKNGGKIEDYYDRINKTATRAGEAAMALKKAQINDKINFGRQTSLLSPEDVQIATELKDIYPDVATALSSVEAQGLRTNMALSQISSTISSGLSTAIIDVTNNTKSFGESFKNLGLVVVQAIQKMVVQLMIVGPLMRVLGGAGGGLMGMLGFENGGVLQGGKPIGQGGIGHAALGRVLNNGNFTAFAGGGIVSSPMLFPMANGTGLMGEAGPEAIMPLKRGADGKLGVAGGAAFAGGTSMEINVNISLEGANGDKEIQRISQQSAAQGVRAGLAQYDSRLPSRIKEIKSRGL